MSLPRSDSLSPLVTLQQTVDGCERILAGEFDDLAESRLYMIGAIEDVGGQEVAA